MPKLKSYHIFWISLFILFLIYITIKVLVPAYMIIPRFRALVNGLSCTVIGLYFLCCILDLNEIKENHKLSKWNIIEVINYLIYNTFKLKK